MSTTRCTSTVDGGTPSPRRSRSPTRCCASSRAWAGSGCTRPTRSRFAPLPRQFEIHATWPSRTRSRPTTASEARALRETCCSRCLRPARYIEADERVEFGELHVFTGKELRRRPCATPSHRTSGGSGDAWRRTHFLRGPKARLSCTPSSTKVVDGYMPVVAGLENDIDESVEDQVSAGDPEVYAASTSCRGRSSSSSARHQAPAQDRRPDGSGFESTTSTRSCSWFLRDVHDDTIRIVERVRARAAQNILTVNATLVGQRQNEETQATTETSVAAERGGQEDLLMGGDPVRPHLGRHHLRDALHPHAGARLALRLPDGDRVDAADGVPALPGFQAPRVALSVVRAARGSANNEPGTHSRSSGRDRVSATARGGLGQVTHMDRCLKGP